MELNLRLIILPNISFQSLNLLRTLNKAVGNVILSSVLASELVDLSPSPKEIIQFLAIFVAIAIINYYTSMHKTFLELLH